MGWIVFVYVRSDGGGGGRGDEVIGATSCF